MLMYYSLYISIGTVVLGVLVVNKDITLQILNNISFKWILERKLDNETKKNETEIELKGIKKSNEPGYLSRYIGIRLTLLGSLFLIVNGIGWFLADFQRVLESSSKIYLDDPNMGRDLISFQFIFLGIFTCSMIFIGVKFSNKKYEETIYKKIKLKEDNKK